MLRFFTVSRLALNPNLIFEIGSINFDLYKTSPTSIQVIRFFSGSLSDWIII